MGNFQPISTDFIIARLSAPTGRINGVNQDWAKRIKHHFGDDFDIRTIPARAASFEPFPEWLGTELVERLEKKGITQLWSHQREAIDSAFGKQHTIISTGTASGKSMAYQLPIAQSILNATSAQPTAIYIAPTKALAHDQARTLHQWDLRELRVATFDGDSDNDERRWAREHANIIVTNPDMIHHGLLGQHERWNLFLRKLEYIAVDECHMYRGVFGAHISNVLKRLIRMAELYGASPTIIMASATVAAPAAHAHMLTNKEFVAVEHDGSAKGNLTIGLSLPPLTNFKDEIGAPIRRSVVSQASDVLTDLVIDGVRSMVFVRSRKSAESISVIAREKLAEIDPALTSKISSYRAGYLPEERREIERQLQKGELLGLAATTALELGIDIPSLDAVVIAGWPGTRASFWQQVGRAGRDQQDAAAILIGNDNPLDHYLVTHPEAIYDQPLEATVCDPSNPNVLAGHLPAAAAERHIEANELSLFGNPSKVEEILTDLCSQGLLRKRPNGWFWAGEGRASALADLRGNGEVPFSIVESDSGRLLGTIDAAGAYYQVHEGAIYVHLGEQYIVDQLDIDAHVALVTATDVEYSTYAREITSVSLVETDDTVDCGPYSLSTGTVDVTEQMVSFQKRRHMTGQLLGEEEIDLPARVLRTQGVWWTVTLDRLKDLKIVDVAGAAHAAEHASIGLLPLFATCDRWDIGGVSIAEHPDNGMCTVVIYDGQPGGAGFARRGYDVAKEWLKATADLIEVCECSDGCPSCIQSPKCGNNNNPLNKTEALKLLRDLLNFLPAI